MEIMKLKIKDYDKASSLMWHTYYQHEKGITSVDGMEKFRDLTSPLSLKMNSFDGYIRLFGMYEEKDLLGVLGIREESHVLLLFVRNDMIGKGIGKRLIKYALKKCGNGDITVNSSDFAVSFYEKFGFTVTGERKTEDGLVFTPMILRR